MISFLQRRWRWLCVTAMAAAILAPCAGAWIFGTLYSAPHNHLVPLPQDLAVEPVAFPSTSGATLRGWLVATNASRGVVILQHGIHSSKSSLVDRARFLSQAGYAVDDLRPALCVKNITAPKLFLAGTRDRETKIAEAEAMFQGAAEPKEFVPVAGARHEDLHSRAPAQYQKLILHFLETHLK